MVVRNNVTIIWCLLLLNPVYVCHFVSTRTSHTSTLAFYAVVLFKLYHSYCHAWGPQWSLATWVEKSHGFVWSR